MAELSGAGSRTQMRRHKDPGPERHLFLETQTERRGSLHVRHGRDPQAARFRENFALPVGTSCCPFQTVRDSIPRQVDKKSGVPQEKKGVWGSQGGDRGLEFSRRRKGQFFFSRLHSLGLYNNNVSCLRTVSGKNLLANPVILKCKLWEWV